MSEWWSDLSLIKQIYYFFAIPATVVLLIQTVMTILGIGADGQDGLLGANGPEGGLGHLGDASNAGANDGHMVGDFQFFSVRGIVAFFAIFGWSGAAMANEMPGFITFIIASVLGLAAMFMIALLFYGMTKLQASGNINLNNAVGVTGEVYSPIPPEKKGSGKIFITIQDSLLEVSAMTEETEKIPTGTAVVVVRTLSGNEVLVKRI